jgi:hypothetical protein
MAHEYAFDVKLFAVVRVIADNEQVARETISKILDCADLGITFKSSDATLKLTEASAYVDDETGPYLFEVDGNDVEDSEG